MYWPAPRAFSSARVSAQSNAICAAPWSHLRPQQHTTQQIISNSWAVRFVSPGAAPNSKIPTSAAQLLFFWHCWQSLITATTPQRSHSGARTHMVDVFPHCTPKGARTHMVDLFPHCTLKGRCGVAHGSCIPPPHIKGAMWGCTYRRAHRRQTPAFSSPAAPA